MQTIKVAKEKGIITHIDAVMKHQYVYPEPLDSTCAVCFFVVDEAGLEGTIMSCSRRLWWINRILIRMWLLRGISKGGPSRFPVRTFLDSTTL